MRIGFFSDTYLPRVDGVVTSIESFRHQLEALGHEVYIFAPRPSLRYREKDDHIIRFSGIKNKELDYTAKFPWTPQAYRKAHKLGLDIVHIHTPFELGTFGIAVALRDNIPLVNTYHTDLLEYARHYPKMLPGGLLLSQLLPLVLGQPELFKVSLRAMKPERSFEDWNEKVVLRFVPLLNNLCDLVISPSEKSKKQLVAMKTTQPIEILPTGVDKITTNSLEISQFYHQYGIAREENVILFVGRIAYEKNLETLIRAFALVAEQINDVKLLMIGDGAHKKQLQELTKSLGLGNRVIFTGYIRNRPKLGAAFEISRVFAFPSVTDTQGLVIGEAAAAGLPSVIVDHGITEVLVNNKSGLYAKNTSADLANKLIKILHDDKLYHKLSKRGIELAAKYSERQQALKLEKLYEDLLARDISARRAKTSRNA